MFLFSSRRRHTRYWRDWSSDVCSSDLLYGKAPEALPKIAYDRMFIGGSTGNLEGIIEHFMEYGTVGAILVINCITLETQAKAMEILKQKGLDRKSTRLNSSHANISYAVFCLKKKKRHD